MAQQSDEERNFPRGSDCLETCELFSSDGNGSGLCDEGATLDSQSVIISGFSECPSDESDSDNAFLEATSEGPEDKALVLDMSKSDMRERETGQILRPASRGETVLHTLFSPSLIHLFSSFETVINGMGDHNPSGNQTGPRSLGQVQETNDDEGSLEIESQADQNVYENLLASSLSPDDLIPCSCITEKIEELDEEGNRATCTCSSEDPKLICDVCYSQTASGTRQCCKFKICKECFKTYISLKVQEAKVRIQCPNDQCSVIISNDDLKQHLSAAMKEKFSKFLVDANTDCYKKTCPRCGSIHTILPSDLLQEEKTLKNGLKVVCHECDLPWCFLCQAPYHTGLTCEKYTNGDSMMSRWAKKQNSGKRNARQCPKCKIWIQKTGGCNFMACTRCGTRFCYRCGNPGTYRSHRRNTTCTNTPNNPRGCCCRICRLVILVFLYLLCVTVGILISGGWVLLLYL